MCTFLIEENATLKENAAEEELMKNFDVWLPS